MGRAFGLESQGSAQQPKQVATNKLVIARRTVKSEMKRNGFWSFQRPNFVKFSRCRDEDENMCEECDSGENCMYTTGADRFVHVDITSTQWVTFKAHVVISCAAETVPRRILEVVAF